MIQKRKDGSDYEGVLHLTQNGTGEFFKYAQGKSIPEVIAFKSDSSYGSCDYDGYSLTWENHSDKSGYYWAVLNDDENTRGAWIGETRIDQDTGFLMGKVWWN